MCPGAAAFPKLGWVSWLTAAPACAGSPSSAAPRCLFLPFGNFVHYYYYTPIQARLGLGASQQRFYHSLSTPPILAPSPPCESQSKIVYVYPDEIIPRLDWPAFLCMFR